MAFEPSEIDRDARAEFDADDVWCLGADGLNVGRIADDAFGEKEPGGEFIVRARGTHRDGNALVDAPAAALVAELNFQGFLDREQVIAWLAGLRAFHADNEAAGNGAFHGGG